MANVFFKRGLQANVPVSTGAIEGAFYLTTDTNRLYIGKTVNSVTKAVPVNEGVTVVANAAALTALTGMSAGDFAYITEGNILAVYNGSHWVQINEVVKLGSDAFAISEPTDGVTANVKSTITDTAGTTKSADFQISVSNGLTLNVVGQEIKIEGDTYDLSVSDPTASDNSVNINLNSAKQADSAISIKGTGGATVTNTGNEITIGINTGDIAAVGSFSSAPVTEHGNGFKFDIGLSNGDHKNTIHDPIVNYGKNVESTGGSVHFVDGKANLNVYSITEIDNLLRGLDAITYKGTVGNAAGATVSVLPTTNVSCGDAYKLIANIDTIGVTGDLVIATGTEDPATGYITGTVSWTTIQHGNEENTTYHIKNTTSTNTFAIEEDTSNTLVGKVSITGGNALTATSSTSDSGKGLAITIDHDALQSAVVVPTVENQTQSASNGNTATTLAIPILVPTVDAYGHVTSITTKTYTVIDSRADLETVTASTGSVTNGAYANFKIQSTSGANKNDQVTFTSAQSTLKVTSGTKNVNIELEWGTF